MPMPISKAEDVAEDGDGGCGASIRDPFVEPVVRVFETFHEEVAEDRVEVVNHLAKCFDALVNRFALGVGDVFTAVGGFEVVGEVAHMGGH